MTTPTPLNNSFNHEWTQETPEGFNTNSRG